MTRTKKRKPGSLQKRGAAMSDLRKEVEPNKIPKPMHGPLLMPKERCESLEGGVGLVWFRNDLRIHDNPALQLANTADAIVPLYIFDPAHYGQRSLSRHGFERVGRHRAKFIVESVCDLRYLLRARGSELLVRVGNTMEIIKSTVQTLVDSKMGPVHVILQKEVTKEETDAENALQQILSTFSGGEDSQIKLHLVWGATLHHVEDLSFNPCGWFFPRTFVKYCKRLEYKATKDVRLEMELPEKIKPFPELPALNSDNIPLIGRDLGVSGVNESLDTPLCDSRSAVSFVGGPTAAMARLKEYVDQRKGHHSTDAAKVYYGEQDSSSKLSPYLALGCISPRTVYWSVKRSGSTFLIDELKTRDYFRFMAANAGLRLFAVNGFAVKEDKPVWTLPESAISNIQREKFKA